MRTALTKIHFKHRHLCLECILVKVARFFFLPCVREYLGLNEEIEEMKV